MAFEVRCTPDRPDLCMVIGNVARVTAEHNEGGHLRARAATLITGSYTYGLRVVERRPVPPLPRSAPAMAMVQTMMLALASMCQLIRSALGSPRGRDSGGSRRPAPSWSPRAWTKGRRPGYGRRNPGPGYFALLQQPSRITRRRGACLTATWHDRRARHDLGHRELRSAITGLFSPGRVPARSPTVTSGIVCNAPYRPYRRFRAHLVDVRANVSSHAEMPIRCGFVLTVRA
jgi:hypothetical protein